MKAKVRVQNPIKLREYLNKILKILRMALVMIFSLPPPPRTPLDRPLSHLKSPCNATDMRYLFRYYVSMVV
jgi:hypothetical protein